MTLALNSRRPAGIIPVSCRHHENRSRSRREQVAPYAASRVIESLKGGNITCQRAVDLEARGIAFGVNMLVVGAYDRTTDRHTGNQKVQMSVHHSTPITSFNYTNEFNTPLTEHGYARQARPEETRVQLGVHVPGRNLYVDFGRSWEIRKNSPTKRVTTRRVGKRTQGRCRRARDPDRTPGRSSSTT